MKKYKAYIIGAAIGIALTMLAAMASGHGRGYAAVGSEFLIVPMCLIAAYALSDEGGDAD